MILAIFGVLPRAGRHRTAAKCHDMPSELEAGRRIVRICEQCL